MHLSRKKLTHCRTCSSVRVDKENKTCQENIEKLRAHSGLVFVMSHDESVTVMADDDTAVNMAGRGWKRHCSLDRFRYVTSPRMPKITRKLVEHHSRVL